ncbi:enoyl-CoA hydratase/isomerase family protein [Microbaculum marinum]|uniref:Enoyl-CoA hydratase/isomerase family protein n=1 Tax=Microbaculum marinum TaxID=1764581 RepID=A0AAW9RUX5_9HYPH
MSNAKTYRDILVRVDNGVGWIVINRPERLNALQMTTTDMEIRAALGDFARDETVRAVVIRGEGERAFSTGWDMEAIEDSSLADLEKMVRQNVGLFKDVWHQPQPVIAAINGHAVASGASLAMSCDIVIAADHAKLAEPEIRHGALSPFLIMPYLTGARAVHEFYYLGDPLDADAMLRLGLANKVVPGADLDAAAQAYGERLALVPKAALEMKKRSLRAAYDLMGLGDAVDRHALADTLMIGADLPEQRKLLDILKTQGMKAFIEARDTPFRSTRQ